MSVSFGRPRCELVALDEHGISRFQQLQNALRAQAALRYFGLCEDKRPQDVEKALERVA